MAKQKGLFILTIILALLLIISVGYITFSFYRQNQYKNQLTAYQSGLQAGYEQAVFQLIQQAVTCSPVPIHVGNQSLSVIAVDCIKQQANG